MTALQKIQLRLSEIRTKLSELGAVEGDLTPEQTAEIGTLRTEYQSCEVRSQALIVAEPVEEETTEETPDAEARAFETLLEGASLGEACAAVVDHRQGRGPHRRAAAALHGLRGNQIPLEMLETRAHRERTEHRTAGATPARGQTESGTTADHPLWYFPQSAAITWLGIPQDERTRWARRSIPVLSDLRRAVVRPAAEAEQPHVPETDRLFYGRCPQPRQRLQASASSIPARTEARFDSMDASLAPERSATRLGSGLDKARTRRGRPPACWVTAGLTLPAQATPPAEADACPSYRGLLYDVRSRIEGSLCGSRPCDVQACWSGVLRNRTNTAASKYRSGCQLGRRARSVTSSDEPAAPASGSAAHAASTSTATTKTRRYVRKACAMDAVSRRVGGLSQ